MKTLSIPLRPIHAALSVAIGVAAAASLYVNLTDEQLGMALASAMLTTAAIYCAVRGPTHRMPRD